MLRRDRTRSPHRRIANVRVESLETRAMMSAGPLRHPAALAQHPVAILGQHESDGGADQGPRRQLSPAQIRRLDAAWARYARRHHLPAGVSRQSLHEDDQGPAFHAITPSLPHPARGAARFAGPTTDGWYPSDDNLAVGSDRVIVAVNEKLGFYNKTGGSLGTLPLTTLFPGAVGNSVFDPRIAYDATNGHFLLVALEQGTVNRTNYSYLDIAASSTSSPGASASDWHIYHFDARQVFSRRSSAWMDFPGLGFDGKTIYVTGNMFSFGSNLFQDAKLMTFSQSAIEGGGPVSGPASTQYFSGGAFGLQPAVVTAGTPDAEYLVETWSSNQIRVHRITTDASSHYTGDTPTILTVNGFGTSLSGAPQKGTTTLIQTNDTRIINAVWSNGSLYAAHAVQDTAKNKVVSQWYQIGTTTGTPTLTRQGRIDPGNDPTTGAPIYTFFPSIGVDGAGDVVLSYAQSSSAIYPSAYYTVITAGGSVSSSAIQNGASYYTPNRWGDYSGVALDQSILNSNVFYAVGQTAASSNTWTTYWAKITA